MKITLAAIAPSRSRAKSSPADALADDYLARAAHFTPTTSVAYPTEAAFLAALDRTARTSARTIPHLILLDPLGQQLTSPALAAHIGRQRDTGAQSLILAIGPADGWSAAARARAALIVSFGPITLPHALARAVLAEQIYRALTILANHPYHSAH